MAATDASAPSASAGCSARRTRASSAARATTSTTSSCPGMLHGASCAARSRTRGSSRSTPRPRCSTRRSSAVITGEDLEALGLAWMPTLSADTQAVLATDKVRFQGQEVAFVVADDHYAARDALELIDVEYEPLPAVVDAAQGARRRRAGHPRRQGGQDRQPHLRLGGRRRGGDRRACSPTPTSSSPQDMLYPRVHPAPMETCGAVADYGPGHRQAARSGARPRRRTRTARSTRSWPACPSTRSRSSRRDIGGGFGNKVPIYPGYVLRDRRLDRHRASR